MHCVRNNPFDALVEKNWGYGEQSILLLYGARLYSVRRYGRTVSDQIVEMGEVELAGPNPCLAKT